MSEETKAKPIGPVESMGLLESAKRLLKDVTRGEGYDQSWEEMERLQFAGYITELSGYCDHWEFNITDKLRNSNVRDEPHPT